MRSVGRTSTTCTSRGGHRDERSFTKLHPHPIGAPVVSSAVIVGSEPQRTGLLGSECPARADVKWLAGADPPHQGHEALPRRWVDAVLILLRYHALCALRFIEDAVICT